MLLGALPGQPLPGTWCLEGNHYLVLVLASLRDRQGATPVAVYTCRIQPVVKGRNLRPQVHRVNRKLQLHWTLVMVMVILIIISRIRIYIYLCLKKVCKFQRSMLTQTRDFNFRREPTRLLKNGSRSSVGHGSEGLRPCQTTLNLYIQWWL